MNRSPDHAQLRGRLLRWYDQAGRDLPWRVGCRETADPYRVWLSEIMCQQTQVATVIPYFERFTQLWPTVGDLAAADRDDVLKAWAGLGYYARARNLHDCAKMVTWELGARFPDTVQGLRALPGIGSYTAAAIAAICFDRPAVPVDGNVVRVLSRFWARETPVPKLRAEVERDAQAFGSTDRTGDFAQALMELGALVCKPRNPNCGDCPWGADCRAFGEGRAEHFPIKPAKAKKPTRYGIAFWSERRDGCVLVTRRPDRGLLGGMPEFPGTEWTDSPPDVIDSLSQAPVAATWQLLPGVVRHTFTHFHLEVSVMAGSVAGDPPTNGRWVAPKALAGVGLPTVMNKIARHALNGGAAGEEAD